MAFAGASLADAVRMATINPARLIGAPGRGRLEPGLRADILLLRGRPDGRGLALWATIAGGERCYDAQRSSREHRNP